jgi:hypothetical protein
MKGVDLAVAGYRGALTSEPSPTSMLRPLVLETDLSGGIQRVAIAHGCAPFRKREGPCGCLNSDPVREPLFQPSGG